MKTTSVKSFAIAIIMALIASANASAQDQAGETAPGLVAVLDVAKVFKENAKFNAKMEEIKAEAERLKADIELEQQQIQKEAEGLAQYEAGSSQRNNLEAQLEQRGAALRTRARQTETDLLNREANIYYETYREMQTVVATLAKEFRISLVLRYESDEIDPANRGDVIKGVNRAVVYHFQKDLTNHVIRSMNPAAAQADDKTPNR